MFAFNGLNLILAIILHEVHGVPDELKLPDAGVERAALDPLDPVVLDLEQVCVGVDGGLVQDAQVGLPDNHGVTEQLQTPHRHQGHPDLVKEDVADLGEVNKRILKKKKKRKLQMTDDLEIARILSFKVPKVTEG